MSNRRSHSTKAIKIMVTLVEVQGLMLVVPQDSTAKETQNPMAVEAQDLMVVEEGLTLQVHMVVVEVKDLGVSGEGRKEIMMEAMGRLPHLLPMVVMVEVGVIKIPTTGAEDVELGEGVDEAVVMEVEEVVVATEVEEVVVAAAEVVVLEAEEVILVAEEVVVEAEGVEETFQLKEGDTCRGVEVWEQAQQLV